MNDKRSQFTVINDIINDILNDKKGHNIVNDKRLFHKPDGLFVLSKHDAFSCVVKLGSRKSLDLKLKKYENLLKLYYRPQRRCGKVVFLHMSVILSMGGVSQHALGQTPPRADTLRADTSSRQTPPNRPLLQRTVRILLECILVYKYFHLVIKIMKVPLILVHCTLY